MNKNRYYTPFFSFVFFLLINIPPMAAAEIRYVTDSLLISVRSGPGKEYKILDNINTGTPMTVLEEKGEFIQVSISDTLKGWVPKYYTETDIPKAKVIESLNREIKRMEQEAEKQAMRLAELEEIDGVKTQNLTKINELDSQLKDIQTKYSALLAKSQDVIETIKERDQLKKNELSMAQQIREITAQNSTLKNYKMIYWLATGGGIFLVGWLIGKLSQKGTRRSLTL